MKALRFAREKVKTSYFALKSFESKIEGKIKIRITVAIAMSMVLTLALRLIFCFNREYVNTRDYHEAVDPKESFEFFSNEISNILEIKLNNTMNMMLMLTNMIAKSLEKDPKATQYSSIHFETDPSNNSTFKICEVENISQCIDKKIEHLYSSLGYSDNTFLTSGVYKNFSPIVTNSSKVIRKNAKLYSTNILNDFLPEIFSHYDILLDFSRNFILMFEEGSIIAKYPAVDTTSDDVFLEGVSSYFRFFNNEVEEKDNWYKGAQSIPPSEADKFFFTFYSKPPYMIALSLPIYVNQTEFAGVLAVEGFPFQLEKQYINQACGKWGKITFDSNGRTFDPYDNINKFEENTHFDLDTQQSFIMGSKKPETNIFFRSKIPQECYCKHLKEKLIGASNLTPLLENITCEENVCGASFFKEILNSRFYKNSSVNLITFCEYNQSLEDNSDYILSVFLFLFITFYILGIPSFLVLTYYYINIFIRDIINPVKQITYKVNRMLKNMFKKTNKIQPDDIVIRERTEIRDISENFSQTFKKLSGKKVFMSETELGEGNNNAKTKVFHTKVSEKMLDDIRNAIDSIKTEDED